MVHRSEPWDKFLYDSTAFDVVVANELWPTSVARKRKPSLHSASCSAFTQTTKCVCHHMQIPVNSCACADHRKWNCQLHAVVVVGVVVGVEGGGGGRANGGIFGFQPETVMQQW